MSASSMDYVSMFYFIRSAFDQVLDKERYDHFRCLAFASHLIESAQTDLSTYRDVHDLLEEFNRKFESFYTVNLCLFFVVPCL